MTRKFAPPPTKFQGSVSAQPKAAIASGRPQHLPPPTRFASRPSVQAKVGPPTAAALRAPSCGCCRPGAAIQRMEGIEYFNNAVDDKVGNAINFAGQSLGPEVQRPKRSFSGERDAQFLRNLSTFFWYVGKAILDDPDAEVESMFVNNRVVISANNPNTMKEIHKFILGNATFEEFVRTDLDSEAEDDPRGLRALNRIYNYTLGPGTSVSSALVLQSIALEKCKEFVALATVRRAGISTDILTAPDYDNKLVLVNGLPIHAEQKLLLTLVSSSLPKNTGVIIRGKKRPCLGCWLCLTFVKEVMGYSNLDFNIRPGKAWKNAISSLESFINIAYKAKVDKGAIEDWAKKKIKAHKDGLLSTYISMNDAGTAQDQGYDSGSDDEYH